MAQRMVVVLSRGQSNHPARRMLEETLAAELSASDGFDVLVIPHLYDVSPDGPVVAALRNLSGDFLLGSWLYPRAAHWTLDQYRVRGRFVHVTQTPGGDAVDKGEAVHPAEEKGPRVLGDRPPPERLIYHLDLRQAHAPRDYVDAVKRLAAQEQPRTGSFSVDENGSRPLPSSPAEAEATCPSVVEEQTSRRWYPVIDFSRCTNCMECIDFCLFGVYGIDQSETIVVEQPDNCRKGCPACSRVCPENAIMFPRHKTPAIAGDPHVGGPAKIDLSQLFGKPEKMDAANEMERAIKERERHRRQSSGELVEGADDDSAAHPQSRQSENDELDDLIDELDDLDL